MRGVERIAGYEIMSEPRTKTVSQSNVRDFMRRGCEAVHAEDPRALCVVGPRPFYKLWELDDDVLGGWDDHAVQSWKHDLHCVARLRPQAVTKESSNGGHGSSSWPQQLVGVCLPGGERRREPETIFLLTVSYSRRRWHKLDPGVCLPRGVGRRDGDMLSSAEAVVVDGLLW